MNHNKAITERKNFLRRGIVGMKWLFLISVLVSRLALIPPDARGQAAPVTQNPGAENAGVEELIQILVAKGLITPEEAAAMKKRQEETGLSSLAALTELLKSKGVLTGDEASKIAPKAAEGVSKAAPSAEKPEAAPPKAVQIVTRGMKKEDREAMKAEIKDEVLKEAKQEIKEYPLPEWLKRIKFYGDIRLRYEGDFFDQNNALFLDPNNPTQLLNSTADRNRFAVRARLGMTAEVNKWAEAGIRLSTGSLTNPVSTNQTMGNYENKYQTTFDLAYLKLKPFPGLTLTGGRLLNPFFFSQLIWYDNLTFDGFVADYRGAFSKMLGGFLTAGAFPLQEIEFSSRDKWLFGGQAGLEFKPRKDLEAKFATTYYYYANTRGIANSPDNPNQFDYTAPQFMQKGNTLFDIDPSSNIKLALAAEYHELNFLGTFDIGIWDPIHIIFLGDYVKNLGFNRSEVAALTGNPNVKADVVGYQFGLSVGHLNPYKFGRWRVYGYYRYLGADAVLDAYTDPYFHLGGTNAKGWIFGGDLGLADNLWMAARWLTANEITGPPFAVDVLQVELHARF